ncbi:MAG: hypothetical protein K6E30_04725 [Lachnospiraceae bacterium]|nr:hypothetical protein [Lachnospiraceae bacterium]
MKKSRRLLLSIVFLISFLLAACGRDKRLKEADSSTMVIGKKGIEVLTVSPFDTAFYDQEEFIRAASAAAEAYNEENGKNRVTFRSFEVEEDVASLLMGYVSAKDYEAFNHVFFRNGLLGEEELAEDLRFSKADGSLVMTLSSILKDDSEGSLRLLALIEPLTVFFPGQVLYVSGDVSLIEGGIKAGKGLGPDELLSEPCYVVYK